MARVYRYAVSCLGAQEDLALFESITALSAMPYAGTTPFEEEDERWNCPLEYALPKEVLPDLTAVARAVIEEEYNEVPHVYQPPESAATACIGVAGILRIAICSHPLFLRVSTEKAPLGRLLLPLLTV